MSPRAASQASILIASDSPAEAELVKTLLEDDFTHIALTIHPEPVPGDLQRHRPDVLVLVFKDLQRSEDYYLGLDRPGDEQRPAYRVVVLCTRESVHAAYEKCRDGLFDDYVLFWPVTHDVPRLLMSVHGSVETLAALKNETAQGAAVAAQLEQLAESETRLAQELSRGEEHVAAAGSPGPLATWISSVQEAIVPLLDAAGYLGALVAKGSARILVVDDDEFQRKLMTRILQSEGYQLSSTGTGSDALKVLDGVPPDLILMDFVMAEMNGIEVIERIKAQPKLASIPVIMITGNSERDVVLRSRALGVIDFVVKPLTRGALITKVHRALRVSVSPIAP